MSPTESADLLLRRGRIYTIHAYTLAGAYANFFEQDRGSITPGKYADLIVLSDDLFTNPPAKILESRVELTMVGGAIPYQAGGLTGA